MKNHSQEGSFTRRVIHKKGHSQEVVWPDSEDCVRQSFLEHHKTVVKQLSNMIRNLLLTIATHVSSNISRNISTILNIAESRNATSICKLKFQKRSLLPPHLAFPIPPMYGLGLITSTVQKTRCCATSPKSCANTHYYPKYI